MERAAQFRDGERVDSSTGTAERLDAVKRDRSRCRRAETTAARRAATAAARPMGGFLNGRARRLGPFSTAGARRLQAFVHYRSSHNRAKRDCSLSYSLALDG